jgi:hypothetical protein
MSDFKKIITVEEAKPYLKILSTNKSRDYELDSLIDDITADIQIFLNRNLFTATYTEYFDIHDDQQVINLKNKPVQTITSVVDYTDTLVEGTNYQVDLNTGKIQRIDDCDFVVGAKTVTVVYTAGYDEADIPRGLKVAAKAYLYDLFYDRNAGAVDTYGSNQRGSTRASLVDGYAPNVAARLRRWQEVAVT